jgi:hypothetical protein
MLCLFLAMLCPFLRLLSRYLAMLCPCVAILHAFAATRREGEGAIHEESRGDRVLHGVPSECVGSCSEREMTRSAYVGIPERVRRGAQRVAVGCLLRRSRRTQMAEVKEVLQVSGPMEVPVEFFRYTKGASGCSRAQLSRLSVQSVAQGDDDGTSGGRGQSRSSWRSGRVV